MKLILIAISSKLRLFKSNVVSVLLYGCCTWKVSKNVTSRLQVFINRCLRNIFRIYWLNRISNEELLGGTEIEPVEIRIKKQKWAWIGHTQRKGEDNIARMAMEWNPFERLGRAPSGQYQTWRRAVERETKKHGKSWRELKLLARNRIRWRSRILDALCAIAD